MMLDPFSSPLSSSNPMLLRQQLDLCALEEHKYVLVDSKLYLAWAQDTDWFLNLNTHQVCLGWDTNYVVIEPCNWSSALRWKISTLVCPD
jgi:hypothetical protein